jgi:hypothetical protein
MRIAGLSLIALGFLVASLSAVVDPSVVMWSYFVPGLLAGVIGVVLARLGTHRAATSKEKLDANIKDIDASLELIVAAAGELSRNKKEIDVYDLPERIEQSLHEPIERFVEAREGLIHVYGLNLYADVMGLFAAGERYMNRVWSAAAEGYIDEAHTYIDRSYEQFEQALAKVAEAKAAQGPG